MSAFHRARTVSSSSSSVMLRSDELMRLIVPAPNVALDSRMTAANPTP